MPNLTRREFIKLGGAALASMTLPPLPARDLLVRATVRRGRVTTWRIRVHTEPDGRAPTVRFYQYDDVISYFEEVEAPGDNPHNSIWLRVIDGYVYSSFVQPVEVHLNTPLQHLPFLGLWGEISTPYADARSAPSPEARRVYRLYYSSVYRIVESVWGDDHRIWYRLYDNLIPHSELYVHAEHVRPIYPEDLAPISPHVYDKRIEVSLAEQLLTAYENDEPVFSTHISGGLGGDRATPTGYFHINFKSPSRHMVGEDYNLPGVPFDSYFWGSVAIHGAYWHNDFGRPRSHGCVNVPSEAARWIFRWSRPLFPYDRDHWRVTSGGTPVIVY